MERRSCHIRQLHDHHHYHHHHHRRKSSNCSNSIGSWISDSLESITMTVVPDGREAPPPSPRCSFCPDLMILGRTSPEIQEICEQRSFTSPSQSYDDNGSSAASICSAPAYFMSPRRLVWSPVQAIKSETESMVTMSEEPSLASLEDLSSSLGSLRFHTSHTSLTHHPLESDSTSSSGKSNTPASFAAAAATNSNRHRVSPTKRYSPTKTTMHRRLSYDMLPTPHELSGARSTRTHRRNTTQIIRQR